MRENGSVELPVTISKQAFIRELEYYGFDMTTLKIDRITCTIPTYDAILHVDNLHNAFKGNILQIQLEKHYEILAYACFCASIETSSLKCTFSYMDESVMFPTPVATRLDDLIESTILSDVSLVETLLTLFDLCRLLSNSVTDSNMNNSHVSVSSFNEHLAVYGYECVSIKTKIVKDDIYFTIHLKPIN
jgi:hypothetical protein